MARYSGGAVDLSSILGQGQGQGQGQQPGTMPASGVPNQTQGNSAAGSGQVIDVPSVVLEISDDTFDQLMQLSQVVPVVVALGAESCVPCAELEPLLESLTRGFEGKVLLAKVDAERNPGLQQAFQVQQLPTVVAVVAGQAIPMFQGLQSEAQIRELYAQVFAVATQNGVVGRVNAPDLISTEASEPEPQVNPEHEPALEAIERGDYPAAIAAYEGVLARAPRDEEAVAALAQVKLLERLSHVAATEVRANAAAMPNDLEAQLLVADLDLSGGHIEDAFLRLLDLFQTATVEDRNVIRERLLELFEIVGKTDARVSAARSRLTNLLFS